MTANSLTERKLHDQGEWLIDYLLACLFSGNKQVGIKVLTIEHLPPVDRTVEILNFASAVPIAQVEMKDGRIITHLDSQHRIDLMLLLRDASKASPVWLPVEIKLGNFKYANLKLNSPTKNKTGSVPYILSAKSSGEISEYCVLFPKILGCQENKFPISSKWGLLLRDGCNSVPGIKDLSDKGANYIFCLHCLLNQANLDPNKLQCRLGSTAENSDSHEKIANNLSGTWKRLVNTKM